MRQNQPRRGRRCGLLLGVLSSASLLLGGQAVFAQVDPTSAEAQELAERYAPIVMVKEQSGPCDSEGEAFTPMSVDVVLSNDDVLLRQAGTGDPVVRRAPTAADLFGRGDGFFLDFNGLALDPGCVYEQDFDKYTAGLEPVVYAHVVQQADRPDHLAVQYWFYWYYNDWNNKHESDWEFIQVVFEASTVAEALSSAPVAVGYAQHEGGEKAAWDSDKLERQGTHPVVYASAGSHASYFSSSTYLGRRGTEGFGCDTTDGPSVMLRPSVITLPHTADAGDDVAWLAFTGRWGERASGPFNGPTGPITKPRWDAPIDWFEDLRGASVSIPGATEGNDTILDTFCGVVGFGSERLRIAQNSPMQTLVLLGLTGWGLRALARRTDWSFVPAVPLRQRRRIGQMLRGAFSSYRASSGALIGVALVYLPAAVVVGLLAAITSFDAAQGVAGLLTSLMLVIAAASISAFWHLASMDEATRPHGTVVLAMRLVRQRLRALAVTLARSILIVSVLSLTVVGLPWAIRQFVRYQFAVSIVVTEGLSGAAALRRSTELVRGRWWHTAFTIGLFTAIATVINGAVQLVLLIGLSGVPLSAYLAISFIGIGLVVPLVATPSILLYGDAAAANASASTPQPQPQP